MVMTTEAPEQPTTSTGDQPRMSDQAKAFKKYKEGVAKSGKPFFPYGVWHDVIAASVVLAIIIGLTVVWFAQANCDSWWNVNCDTAATPMEQEHYTPDDPGTIVKTSSGAVDERAKGPLLGPLYEEKADPATDQYHPRPEWYFYFLFYLLIVFSHPQLVLLGTIIVPTIFLVALLAWPFLDRRKERRPSRRPIAMSAMVFTAIVLLAMSYLGSTAGETTIEGISAEQQEMPGFPLLFEDSRATCTSCHVIGGSGGNVGPALDDVASKDYGIEYQIQHLVDPAGVSGTPGMPSQEGIYNEEELAQIAAFLETLGEAERATDPAYTGVDAETTKDALAEAE
jgi:ubiquinol-cytochrome c reductase cytochrome b subunit/menaquinol-cytochrome c reductase cytochrome b/c subunit